MAVRFAERMGKVEGSAIRELLKLTARPEVISFAGGMPAPELFPVEEMKKVSVAVLEEQGKVELQYTTTEGYLPLREKIADRMNKTLKTNVGPDDILITSGSQQGLDFSGKAFKDIVVKLKYCEKTKKKLTYEDLYNLLDFMIRKIIAFNPKIIL